VWFMWFIRFMLLLLVLSVELSWAFSCTYSFPAPTKATFDLSALTKTDGTSYHARDSDQDDEFFYEFNVCANVNHLPITNPPMLCKDIQDPANLFAAYQIVNSSVRIPSGACFVIGTADSPSWTFINENDESIGLQLVYNGGQTTQCPQARKFLINFRCAHAGLAYRRHIGVVYEDTLCEYMVDFYTIHACPQECAPKFSLDGDDSICNAQGLCSLDEDKQGGTARCFCFQGRGGDDCSQEVTPLVATNPNTVLIALIFALLALIALLAGILFFKIRKLNADDSNYGQLKEESTKDATLPTVVPS